MFQKASRSVLRTEEVLQHKSSFDLPQSMGAWSYVDENYQIYVSFQLSKAYKKPNTFLLISTS